MNKLKGLVLGNERKYLQNCNVEDSPLIQNDEVGRNILRLLNKYPVELGMIHISKDILEMEIDNELQASN